MTPAWNRGGSAPTFPTPAKLLDRPCPGFLRVAAEPDPGSGGGFFFRLENPLEFLPSQLLAGDSPPAQIPGSTPSPPPSLPPPTAPFLLCPLVRGTSGGRPREPALVDR